MTVSTTTNRVRASGDGSTTTFLFPYSFEAATHLEVIVTDAEGVETVQLLSTHYTVSGAGKDSGGSVSFSLPPAAAETVTILRREPLTQETDANDVGSFRAQAFEAQFDRFARMAQRLEEAMGRALKFRRSSGNSDIDFPEPVAGKAIAWNGDGTALETVTQAASGAETLPATASRYIRRNDSGTAYVARTAAEVRVDIGLGQVDDTADADKPVSAAQQLALDGKAAVDHGHAIADVIDLQSNLDAALGAGAPHVVIEDQKPAGTDGGTLTAGAYIIRDLNTVVRDPEDLASLSQNEVTFANDGWVEFSAPAYKCDTHQSRLYNVSDAEVTADGTSHFSQDSSATADSASTGGGLVEAGKTYRIETRGAATAIDNGLGIANTFGSPAIYSRLRYWRV
ncbi:MAG: hypothetical protein AAGC96_17830 [Pseudomonadota bacterium]